MPRRAAEPHDPRPALLSVVALMFLLLPLLLLTTSVARLVGLDLAIAGESDLPPSPAGQVESLELLASPKQLSLRAGVRRTDVVTSAGDVEQREVVLEPDDLAGLQEALRQFKGLDPERERALLRPTDDLPTRSVVHLMDAMRGDAQGPLYPQVALGGVLGDLQ